MATPSTYSSVYFLRRPVFTDAGRVWGQQMVLHGQGSQRLHSCTIQPAPKADDTHPRCEDAAHALLTLVAALSTGHTLPSEGAVLVPLPQEALQHPAPFALPAERTVFLLHLPPRPDRLLLENVIGLCDAGYRFCFACSEAHLRIESLMTWATLLMPAHMPGVPPAPDELAAFAEAARTRATQARLLLTDVQTAAARDEAVRAGFELFGGPFFTQAQVVEGRTVASPDQSKLRIFELIEQENPDLGALAETIEADASLSYRLLSFLNSAAFGLPHTVSSIRHAVGLAGWKKLRSWLQVIIFTDMMPSEKAQELAVCAARRAKFLQLAARRAGADDMADTLFLAGLFSLLEPMYDASMHDLVEDLPLPREVLRTLLGEATPLTPWMFLAECMEIGEAMGCDGYEDTLASVSLSRQQADSALREAVTWTDRLFSI